MDTLLSPRRRTVLQALAAAALVTACGDRRGAATAPMIEFRGPTMGTSFTAKIADPGCRRRSHCGARPSPARLTRLPRNVHLRTDLSCRGSTGMRTSLRVRRDAWRLRAGRGSERGLGRRFDITIRPVVDAWIGPSKAQRAVGDAEIASRGARRLARLTVSKEQPFNI
jgi:hypothetical protein